MLTMAIPDVEICMIFVVRSIVLIYSPDGTNDRSLRGGEFEGIGSAYGVESYKIMFPGSTSCLLVQTLAVGCIV